MGTSLALPWPAPAIGRREDETMTRICVAACLWLGASSALAQSVTLSSAATVGPNDCSDSGVSTLSYTIPQQSSATTPTTQLFASEASCPSVDSTATSVTLPTGAIELIAHRSITATDEAGSTTTLSVSKLAGGDCAAVQTRTWNVCLYEFWQTAATTYTAATHTNALSTVTVTYDAQPPGAPTLTMVTAGDQHLKASFDAPGDSDISEYRVLVALKNVDQDEAIAAAAADGGAYGCYAGAQSHSAGTDTSGVSVPPGNELVDGKTYVVQVQAIDAVGNAGPCSNPMDGTPRLINDFWRQYEASGGTETGCVSAPVGDLALLVVWSFVVLRRRRRGGIRVRG
jgi:hypothetical protein